MREAVAIKNVVQGRRLEGGSPWLLFFVLSTLAPPFRHLSTAASLSTTSSLPFFFPLFSPSLALTHFLPSARSLQRRCQRGFHAGSLLPRTSRSFLLERALAAIFLFSRRNSRPGNLIHGFATRDYLNIARVSPTSVSRRIY